MARSLGPNRCRHRLEAGWLAAVTLSVLVALPVLAISPSVVARGPAFVPDPAIGTACPWPCTRDLSPHLADSRATRAVVGGNSATSVVSAPTGSGEDAILQSIAIQNATLYAGIGQGAWGQSPLR